MMLKTHDVKFTYEDFLLFADDGRRHELIDGARLMTPAPSTKHQRISLRLAGELDRFVRCSQLGHVFAAPCDVVLSNLDVVEPDILFVSSARAEIVTEPYIKGAPDLVVEILSPTSRKTDEVVKRKLYEQYGVAEYWIVDPELETVKVYRMTDEGYRRVAELSREEGDRFSSSLFPGLDLSLEEVFTESQ